MIQAIDLTKRYEDDGLLALNHLNLRVQAGQIYCLLGANGAGKTTTINLFFNFIEPTSGTAKINRFDCTKEPLEAKKYAAYVSENVMLYGNFAARQNLDFFSKLAGRKNLKKEDYHMVIRQVGLPEWSFEKRVKTFSKGMRQKLGIAITSMTQNEIQAKTRPRAASLERYAEYSRAWHELVGLINQEQSAKAEKIASAFYECSKYKDKLATLFASGSPFSNFIFIAMDVIDTGMTGDNHWQRQAGMYSSAFSACVEAQFQNEKQNNSAFTVNAYHDLRDRP